MAIAQVVTRGYGVSVASVVTRGFAAVEAEPEVVPPNGGGGQVGDRAVLRPSVRAVLTAMIKSVT